MYWATDPSLVARVAFLAATETPFLRRTTTAASISPLASVRACLQSIIGAPVFSRSSFTCVAEMFVIVVLIAKNLHCKKFQGFRVLKAAFKTWKHASYKLRPAPDDPRGSEFQKPRFFWQLATGN